MTCVGRSKASGIVGGRLFALGLYMTGGGAGGGDMIGGGGGDMKLPATNGA